jgi:hypothetical protein
MHQPERLAFAGPFVDGPDQFYRVSLVYRNQLTATCDIASIDPARFVLFFEDLAQQKGGWEGEKRAASPEGQLTLTCTYEKMYRPEVWMDVYCTLDFPSFDPYWVVRLRLELDPQALDDLAVRARQFFTKPA